MKRDNFGTEGQSRSFLPHRSHGSTGQCQDPAESLRERKWLAIWGQEGHNTEFEVVSTDEENGLILVRGAVPGAKGGWVTISDAVKKSANKDAPMQHP